MLCVLKVFFWRGLWETWDKMIYTKDEVPIKYLVVGVAATITLGALWFYFHQEEDDEENDELKSKSTSKKTGWKLKVQKELMKSKKVKHKPSRIIHLDKTLEYALNATTGKDATVAENLKEKGTSLFSPNLLKKLRSAHTARNLLAHELHPRIPERDLMESIRTFELALRTLIE